MSSAEAQLMEALVAARDAGTQRAVSAVVGTRTIRGSQKSQW